jgi:hypothetical protein
MRVKQGGTQMHCPHCEEVTVCKAISPCDLGETADRHLHFLIYTDVNWLRRARRCLDCNRSFLTAEVDEEFLDELVELRGALAEIKANAEQYLTESTSAAKSLERLTQALSVLKALKLYDEA